MDLGHGLPRSPRQLPGDVFEEDSGLGEGSGVQPPGLLVLPGNQEFDAGLGGLAGVPGGFAGTWGCRFLAFHQG